MLDRVIAELMLWGVRGGLAWLVVHETGLILTEKLKKSRALLAPHRSLYRPRYFGFASCKPRSGGSSFPLRRSLTACTSARAALRTSSCRPSSMSRSSWLVA